MFHKIHASCFCLASVDTALIVGDIQGGVSLIDKFNIIPTLTIKAHRLSLKQIFIENTYGNTSLFTSSFDGSLVYWKFSKSPQVFSKEELIYCSNSNLMKSSDFPYQALIKDILLLP